MGLLHSKTDRGQPDGFEAARPGPAPPGVPTLPQITLPALPDLSGGAGSLADVLGQAGAATLRALLDTPEVRAQLQGALEGQAQTVSTYLQTLERTRSQVLEQVGVLASQQAELAQRLSALQAAALPVDVAARVAQAVPAVGALLGLATQGAADLQAQLSGLTAQLDALGARLAALTDARTAAQALLAEVQARLAQLPALFDTLQGGEDA